MVPLWGKPAVLNVHMRRMGSGLQVLVQGRSFLKVTLLGGSTRPPRRLILRAIRLVCSHVWYAYLFVYHFCFEMKSQQSKSGKLLSWGSHCLPHRETKQGAGQGRRIHKNRRVYGQGEGPCHSRVSWPPLPALLSLIQQIFVKRLQCPECQRLGHISHPNQVRILILIYSVPKRTGEQ